MIVESMKNILLNLGKLISPILFYQKIKINYAMSSEPFSKISFSVKKQERTTITDTKNYIFRQQTDELECDFHDGIHAAKRSVYALENGVAIR